MFGFRRKAATAAAPGAAEWRARGNAALGQGQLVEAADCYRQAAACDPADAEARVNLGYVLLEQGAAVEAAGTLSQAVALAGERTELLADAQFLLGRAHRLQGQDRRAAASYRAALAARPGFAESLQELVPLLLDAGQAGEAVAFAQRAAQAAPRPQVLMLLAQALHAAGRAAEALVPLDAVLASDPGDAAALACRGNVLLELGRCEEALASSEQVLGVHGRQADALANASAALLRLERNEAALALAEEALRLQPAHRVSLHNRSCALTNLLRMDEALLRAREATLLHPDDADLQWSLGVAHLLRGDLAPGWKAHEARWHAKDFPGALSRAFTAAPQWTGAQALEGRCILLHAEQGLGDSIHFVRYLPQVAARAREVLVHVQQSLVPLLAQLPANCRLLQPGEPIPPHELQCPLLSLPHAFGTTLATIPADVPYLQADPERLPPWQQRLAGRARPQVGIVWSGNPQHGNDRNRSIPLHSFVAIAQEGVGFVSLQVQVRESDRAAMAHWPGLFDAGPLLHDFGDTAALASALDLVVTVDTSVAHLAGALGKPVWVLLPYVPDWRWMLGREDSPWYPGMRLFRQPARGDWDSVLQRVRSELRALASS
ncbi:tetratricopeptide repeat protein [Ramlibacter montanisoli]|uniref:Tetratricopeptide repeat protein n=1 Tax=Ramlibacter montanisoli TaxID=2732512 RepID=A0A849KF40_9BURK|nr:tetratricopeptide repeat protein [Ramlibacter montanisoli]NNU44867.1 tetratricopeptide repeat protein [Ramlibacter montanisoli]